MTEPGTFLFGFGLGTLMGLVIGSWILAGYSLRRLEEIRRDTRESLASLKKDYDSHLAQLKSSAAGLDQRSAVPPQGKGEE